MEPITVKYKVLDARAKVPAYATPGSAAADLCAALEAEAAESAERIRIRITDQVEFEG